MLALVSSLNYVWPSNLLLSIAEGPSNKLTINTDKLKQDKLLLRYVDNKEQLELHCLYAVQALANQLSFPQGQCYIIMINCRFYSTLFLH